MRGWKSLFRMRAGARRRRCACLAADAAPRQTLRDVPAHDGGIEPVEIHLRISREISNRADQHRLGATLPAEAPAVLALDEREPAAIEIDVRVRLGGCGRRASTGLGVGRVRA